MATTSTTHSSWTRNNNFLPAVKVSDILALSVMFFSCHGSSPHAFVLGDEVTLE